MIELLNDLAELENASEPFCMAVIIQSRGSTPRSSGARMLILKNGIKGTIGGGKLEAEVINTARDVLNSRVPRILDFEFSGTDAASLDMICGGTAKILLEPIWNGSPFWDLVHTIKAQGESGWIVSEIFPENSIQHRIEKVLPDDLVKDQRDISLIKPVLVSKQDQLIFADPLTAPTRVFIFGAGHVSRSLAAITHLLGFHTIVIDDRADFADRTRFPNSEELVVENPITNVFQNKPIIHQDMIVIVTRGHLQDQVVLEQALSSGAGYVGMIGSKRKCALIFQALREKGYTEDRLARVSSPIGIDIGAETPEEIAVSISAELIQKRAALRAG